MVLRHKNGRGFIGEGIDINFNSYLSPNSTAFGDKTEIDDSTVINSIIDNSRIFQADIRNCNILNSQILSYKKAGLITRNSGIVDSTIKGNASVLDSKIVDATVKDFALVENSTVENCVIGKSAVLRNAQFVGCGFIEYGTWTRPPKFLAIRTQTLKLEITESTDGYAYIGCQRKPIRVWLKGYKRFGRAANWSDSLLNEVVHFLEQLNV